MSDKLKEVPSWDVPDFPKPGPAGDMESDVPAENNSDAETDSAFSRIENALRDVAYQLGESEPAPSSPDTPAHTPAPNINAVTLEYTRSFNELAQRIDNLEKKTETESLRDEIRGLRQRLVEETDQFNRALDESAGNVSTLTGAVENLSNSLTAMRDEPMQLGDSDERIPETVESRLSITEHSIESFSQRLERTELGRERSDQAVKQTLTALLEKLSAEKERNEIALAEARTTLTSALDEMRQSLEASEKSLWEELESRFASGESKIEDLAQRPNQAAPDLSEIENKFERHFESILDQLTTEKERSADALAEVRVALASSVSEMKQSLDATERQVEWTLESRLSSVDAKFESIAQRLDQSEQGQSGSEDANSETIEIMSHRLEQIEQERNASEQKLNEAAGDIMRRLEKMEQDSNAREIPVNETAGDVAQRLEQMERDGSEIVGDITQRLERMEHDRNAGIQPLNEAVGDITQRLERMEQDRNAGIQPLNEAIGDIARRLERMEQDRNAGIQPLNEAVGDIARRLERMEQDRNASEQPISEAVDAVTRRLEQMERDSVAKASLFEQNIAELKGQLIAEKTRSEEAQTEIPGAVAELNTISDGSVRPQEQSSEGDFAFENFSRVQSENNRPVAEIIEELTASQNMDEAQVGAVPVDAQLPELAERVDVSSIVPSSFEMPPIESTDAAASELDESFSGQLISDKPLLEEQQSDEQQVLGGTDDYLSGENLSGENDAETDAADAVNLDDVPNSPMHSLATRATSFKEKLTFLRQNRMAAIGASILLVVGAGIVLFSRGSNPEADTTIAAVVPPVATEQVAAQAGSTAPSQEQGAVEIPSLGPPMAALSPQPTAEIPAPGVTMTSFSSLPTVEIQGPAVSDPALSTSQAAEPGEPSTIESLISQANAGSSPAALLLGLKYLDGDGVATNEDEAFRWLHLAAEQGEPVAQNHLGSLFERGQGVAVDLGEAAFWYGQAASNGNVVAMHNLAIAHTDGAGVERDLAEAARLFEDAADLGLADSQFNLAVLYSRGMGVPASPSDAYKWYLIAAAQGDPEAQSQADALASQLAQNERDAADAAASAFVPQSPNEAANTLPSLAQIQ